jgi:hypothetical protein
MTRPATGAVQAAAFTAIFFCSTAFAAFGMRRRDRQRFVELTRPALRSR